MKFLVLIVNPKKSTIVTNKLFKAIFESFYDNQVIKWGIILEDVISKEVNKVSNKKRCPLVPFFHHLYCLV